MMIRRSRHKFSGHLTGPINGGITGSTAMTSGVKHAYPLGASGIVLGGIGLYLYGLYKFMPLFRRYVEHKAKKEIIKQNNVVDDYSNKLRHKYPQLSKEKSGTIARQHLEKAWVDAYWYKQHARKRELEEQFPEETHPMMRQAPKPGYNR